MNVPFLRPRGCPVGIDPSDWRKALEQRIDQHAAALSTLIDALDAMDGECDREPWLGSPELNPGYAASDHWASGINDDREQEDEHGGDVLDERHDEIDEGNTDYSCDDDLPIASQMSDADREAVCEECDRLIAKAYAQVPD
jgi:hypothetical protein